MKRLSMFLLIILVSVLYGASEFDMPSMEGVFSVSSNQVPFLINSADQFSEDILTRQEDTIKYTNMVVYNAIGLTGGGTFEYGGRFTDAEFGPYFEWYIIAIFFHSYDGSSPTGVVKIYDEGSSTQPGSLITTEPYSGASSPGWYRVDLTNPVLIDSNEKWCTVEVTHPAGPYPASVDPGPHFPGKSQWICLDGVWHELTYYNGSWTWNWAMGIIVEEEGSVAEQEMMTPIKSSNFGATIFSGPLLLPEGKKCKVYDVTGRTVIPEHMEPGVYFIEIDDRIVHKIVKIR